MLAFVRCPMTLDVANSKLASEVLILIGLG